jgi:hypothetical protein
MHEFRLGNRVLCVTCFKQLVRFHEDLDSGAECIETLSLQHFRRIAGRIFIPVTSLNPRLPKVTRTFYFALMVHPAHAIQHLKAPGAENDVASVV